MALVFRYQERRSIILMIGCAASIGIMLFPPLDIIENNNLTVRMIEDMLIFVYAIIFGYVLEKYANAKLGTKTISSFSRIMFESVKRLNISTKGIVFALLIPAVLLTYWNYPSTFDLTAQSIYLRYASDLSYLVSAILIGMALIYIPRKFRVLLLYFMFMSVGMMGSMMLVWVPGFYTFYSSAQNTDMNTFMMMFGAFGIIGTSSYLLKVMDVI